MRINKTIVAYMSPTGGVKKVAGAVAEGFKEQTENVSTMNFITPRFRALKTALSPDTLFIFCFPVYFGRMPKCIYDWKNLEGNGALAFIVNVYGNRLCEDAPREAADFLTAHGFKVIGYAESVAEHSQERKLAHGRPDVQDTADLKAMAADVYCKACAYEGDSTFDFHNNAPYKPYGQVPFVPQKLTDEECANCKVCIKICPMGIIDPKTCSVLEENKEKCMGCRACIAVCKKKIRGIPPQVLEKIAQKMAVVMANNSERKPNRYFLI